MENVTAWVTEPDQPARTRPLPEDLHPEVRAALEARGVQALYTHQAEAWARVRSGRNVMVVTPTASGKTLCYNLPVLDAVCRTGTDRALYLFPTKALSQDQVAELNELAERIAAPVQCYTYDGDTPLGVRQKIREAGHIVVTNPDMLHSAILPHHTKWLRLFENLRYVVIDEAHVYRGVFGSHVANVIRRLRRICAYYGSRPQFILCSATVANPADLAHHLTGEDADVIDQSGAPRGERHIILYNPPLVHRQLGIRRSALLEARRIAGRLLRENIPTIAFVRTRTQVELLAGYLKQDAPERLRGAIVGYRGGYLPNERRSIERGLRQGQIRGVVSTNALELGVDIGSLQAAVSVGYPGTVASLRQQMGRAGRRGDIAVALYIATASPLDQYLVRQPDQLLARSPEEARLNPDNLLILMDHLKCAAYELPFREDERFGVETTAELLEYLAEARVLHRGGDGRYFWMADSLPSHSISLRSAAQDNVVVLDVSGPKPVAVGETDRFSALTMLHEEAIYLHQSRAYQVEKLDLENGKAFVRPVQVDYYTDAELAVRLAVLDVLETRLGPEGAEHMLGEVMVNATPTLFKKIKFETHENLGWGKIHLPEAELHSIGYRCSWDAGAFGWGRQAWESALIGAVHALRQAAALHCMCNVSDIHGYVEVRDLISERPALFLYDAYPGGVGLAERVYRSAEEVFATAHAMVAGCGCESGCPSCVGPHEPHEGVKARALVLLAEGARVACVR